MQNTNLNNTYESETTIGGLNHLFQRAQSYPSVQRTAVLKTIERHFSPNRRKKRKL